MKSTATENQPIACTLIEGDFRDRLAWIAELTRDALRSYERADLTLKASAAMSAQPKSKNAMDAHDETGRRVPPPAANPASLAECALRRQTPEVGAECPNWARSDLCGLRLASASNSAA